MIGLKAERELPRFTTETFGRWLKGRPATAQKERVAYYAGCTANYVEPEIGRATVGMLERAGLSVVYPEQVCCGLPQMSNGRLEAARRNAHRNIRSLLGAECDVVTACTSCALALKREYEHALGVDGAAELAERTYDVMEYAGRLLAAGRLVRPTRGQDRKVLYHAPCHLKARGDELVEGRVELMASLPGVEARQVDRGCCGMAGTFGSKRDGYSLSMTIGGPLFEEVRQASGCVVATDCPTCAMQLKQGTGVRPVHPVVLLEQAYEERG
jgi:glycerol-3-phosphate dehydrogenase subunit C